MNSFLSIYIENLQKFFPFSIYFKTLVLIFILSTAIQLFVSRHKNTNLPLNVIKNGTYFILAVCRTPLLIFLGFYFLYLTLLYISELHIIQLKQSFFLSLDYVIEFFTLFWCLQKSLVMIKAHTEKWLYKKNFTTLFILFKIVSNSFEAIVYIIVLNILVPQLGFTGFLAVFSQKLMHLMLIGVIGWILIQILNGAEQLIINHVSLTNENMQNNRKITTQVKLLKRILLAISIVVIIASMLMVFDSVRSLGTGLLTTAGIVGAAGAFASQRSLAGLFSGLNIAFTQPIRIGDTIVVDNQSGQVEEITLSYVVIKLWDLRRLILPTDYFTTKGVVNLTRNSTELVGSINFYVDYTLKIEVLREKFTTFLNESTLWDKKTSALQISELKEQSVEIRALVSARNSNDLWNLRCEIREKLLNFIVENFPASLPKTRQALSN